MKAPVLCTLALAALAVATGFGLIALLEGARVPSPQALRQQAIARLTYPDQAAPYCLLITGQATLVLPGPALGCF